MFTNFCCRWFFFITFTWMYWGRQQIEILLIFVQNYIFMFYRILQAFLRDNNCNFYTHVIWYIFCSKGMKTINKIAAITILWLIPWSNEYSFLQQGSTIFAICNHQNNYFVLALKIMFWYAGLFYFFHIIINKKNIKSSWCFLVLLENLLLSSYIYIKIHCESFRTFSWFSATVTAYWKHLSSLFLRLFIAWLWTNSENLCMIRHHSNLFHDIYNAINQYNQRQN